MASELQLDQMTIEEKLQIVDELWLSMTPELESLEVSPGDRELVDERWAAFLEAPSLALTFEEFRRHYNDFRRNRH